MKVEDEVAIEIIKNSTIDDHVKYKYSFTEEQMNKAITDVVKLFSMHSVIVPVCPHCNSTNSAEVDNRHCLDCSESFTAK